MALSRGNAAAGNAYNVAEMASLLAGRNAGANNRLLSIPT